VLTRPASRVLTDADLPQVRRVLDTEPVASAWVASRIAVAGLAEWRLGGQVWGYEQRGVLRSLCYSGANLVPVAATPDALPVFAQRARSQGRMCSSVVGPADAVLPLWSLLERSWGRAREVRACQPLLVASAPPPVTPSAAVRRAVPADLDAVLPACVAMYTEEIGVSPIGRDGGAFYRARVAESVRAGRTYVQVEGGRVVFKAELAAVTPAACQVQGVWVAPDRRGEGLGAAGMAAVVTDALRVVAPVVSLYVNDFNAPALAVYGRCGFRQVGTFASVLF
jgi:predicted GNAT family acetyltransferase